MIHCVLLDCWIKVEQLVLINPAFFTPDVEAKVRSYMGGLEHPVLNATGQHLLTVSCLRILYHAYKHCVIIMSTMATNIMLCTADAHMRNTYFY